MLYTCTNCGQHYSATHTHSTQPASTCPHCANKPTRLGQTTGLSVALLLGISACKRDTPIENPEPPPFQEPSEEMVMALYGGPPIEEIEEPIQQIDNDADGFTSDVDCDDKDANTFPGAARKESASACMTDADRDGYGSKAPKANITAGSDCNDNDAGIQQLENCDTLPSFDPTQNPEKNVQPAYGVPSMEFKSIPKIEKKPDTPKTDTPKKE